MSSDNQFTALGPTEIGFQTNGTRIRIGASIAGNEVGVVGSCEAGIGVEGAGGVAGVHGRGVPKPADVGAFRGPTGVGVLGESVSSNGVRGTSVTDDGVVGIAAGQHKSGVFGFNSARNDPTQGTVEFPRGKQVGFGVFGRCDLVDGAGVGGRSEGVDPVTKSGGVGVIGTSQAGDGVVGVSDASGKSGVFGFNASKVGAAFGVTGKCDSAEGIGVNGASDHGLGVQGASTSGDGVVGSTSGTRKSGVFGFNTQRIGPAFGVSGRSDSTDGAGINGFSNQGYGGRLSGVRAQLYLEPARVVGPPSGGDHQRGELLVDSHGDLFYCKESGNPGMWFYVNLIPT